MRKCVQGVSALLVALISAAKAMALLPDHT